MLIVEWRIIRWSTLTIKLLPSNVFTRASALARDVAYYGATNVISQPQRPGLCCKGPLREVAGKRGVFIYAGNCYILL